MKRIIILFICIWTGLFTVRAADSLRVVTYNLRFGELATMDAIGQALASMDADIVFLQECDWNTQRTRAKHQNGVKFINVLAARTGMFGLYCKSIDYKGGYYGIGLLSRYPVVSSRRILLPREENTEQRSLFVVDVELPGGKIVTAACTHLEVSSSKARMEQVRFITKQLRGKSPVILAGDMNAEPDSEEMGILCKRWKNLTDTEYTFSTYEPAIKIDYIFARPAEDFDLIGTQVVKDCKLSDHFPVISDIIVY